MQGSVLTWPQHVHLFGAVDVFGRKIVVYEALLFLQEGYMILGPV